MAMTAARPPKPESKVSFTRPSVSDRLYLVQGPSGWNEVFLRDKVDKVLEKFLGKIAILDAVKLFVGQREISEDKEPETWFTITGFLGRLLGVTPLAVPPEAAIAFWGHCVLETNNRGAN